MKEWLRGCRAPDTSGEGEGEEGLETKTDKKGGVLLPHDGGYAKRRSLSERGEEGGRKQERWPWRQKSARKRGTASESMFRLVPAIAWKGNGWICWQWLDLLSSVCHRGATEWTLEPNPQLQVEWDGRRGSESPTRNTPNRWDSGMPVLA